MSKRKKTPKGVKITYKDGFADTITVIDVVSGRKIIKKGGSATITAELLNILERQGFRFDIG